MARASSVKDDYMKMSGRSRKAWTPEEKSAIVREAMGGDVTVVGTARKYGISTVSIYSWRKDVQEGRLPAAHVADADADLQRGEVRRSDTPAAPAATDSSERASPALGELARELAAVQERLGKIEARQRVFEENRVALRDVLRAIGSQLQLLARLGDLGFPSAPASSNGQIGLPEGQAGSPAS